MSKRSNRTRGNRRLNMGASLRARQMTPPRHTGRGGSNYALPPDIDIDPAEILLLSEASDQLMTEDGLVMVAQ